MEGEREGGGRERERVEGEREGGGRERERVEGERKREGGESHYTDTTATAHTLTIPHK